MQREVVSVGHRYVQTLMNALVLGVKDQATIEQLINEGMDRVDKITPKDRVRLLELVPKTAKQLGIKAVPEEIPEPVLETTGEELFFLDDEEAAKVPPNPVREGIRKYLHKVADSLRAETYRERFYVSLFEHKGPNETERFLIVVSGTFRNKDAEYNVYGTSGAASNFGGLSNEYFYCTGGSRVSEQLELDNVGPFDHIVLWGWALNIVPGREIRLWINKRGSKDRARARLTMDPKEKTGYRVTRRHFEPPETGV